MKKLLFVIIALSLVASAWATDTRVTTMGEVNNVVMDEANIWMYPHTIAKYPKLFTAEYSSGSDFSSVGIHRPWNDKEGSAVLGLYFYENTPVTFSATNSPMIPNGFGMITAPNHRLTLFYGTKLSDRPFGLAINYIQASQKSEEDGNDMKRSNFELDLVVSTMVNDNLEIGSMFSIWNFDDKDAAGDDVSETSGNMLFDIYGRYWMDKNGKFQKVIHAGVGLYKETLNYGGGDQDYSDFAFELGMGCNYQSAENILVVTDFGIMYLSDKFEMASTSTTDTYFVLPYFKAGIDAYVFKWVNLRAGVASYWNNDKYENDEKYSYVNTNTYLGAGFHWGHLEIDAQVSPAFLSAGPYFVSGNSAGDLASRFSLNYWFE